VMRAGRTSGGVRWLRNTRRPRSPSAHGTKMAHRWEDLLGLCKVADAGIGDGLALA